MKFKILNHFKKQSIAYISKKIWIYILTDLIIISFRKSFYTFNNYLKYGSFPEVVHLVKKDKEMVKILR